MITKERIDIVRSRAKGFTLIEILIVVAIIAILASVVLVGLGPTQKEGRDSRRISDLTQVQTALELYYNHCGWYPGGTTASGSACPAWTAATPGTNDIYVNDMSQELKAVGIGVTQLPADPTNSGAQEYAYETNSQNSYTLSVTLEDPGNSVLKSDETTDPNGSLACGTAGLYCVSL
jgi:prepilin-type N-terminal cleavage/methylation domain-containing protein